MRRRRTQPRANRRLEPSTAARQIVRDRRRRRSLCSARRRRAHDRVGDKAFAGAERPVAAGRLRVRPAAGAGVVGRRVLVSDDLHESGAAATRRLLGHEEAAAPGDGRRAFAGRPKRARIRWSPWRSRLPGCRHLASALGSSEMGRADPSINDLHDELFDGRPRKEGTRYERLTSLVVKILDPTATVMHDRDVAAGLPRRSVHQIDVVVDRPGHRGSQRLLIECRHHGRSITKKDVQAHESASRQIGAHPVLVTTVGYQSGAKTFAEDEGVTLLVLRRFTDADREGRLMEVPVKVEMTFEFPCPSDIRGRMKWGMIGWSPVDAARFLVPVCPC
jgi:hypothetical protein